MNSKIYYRDIYRKANYYKNIVLRIIDEIDSKCEQAAMSHFNGIDARISCNELYISDGLDKRNIVRIITEKDLSFNRINDMIIDSLKSNNFDDKDIEVSYDIDRSIDDEDIKDIIYNVKVLFFSKEEIDNML